MARKKRSDAGVPRARRAAAAPAGGLARARNLGARVADTLARGATRAATALRVPGGGGGGGGGGNPPIITPPPRPGGGGAIIPRTAGGALAKIPDPSTRTAGLTVRGRRGGGGPTPPGPGGPGSQRREEAIRNLATGGATPGERAAAVEAARRQGIEL